MVDLSQSIGKGLRERCQRVLTWMAGGEGPLRCFNGLGKRESPDCQRRAFEPMRNSPRSRRQLGIVVGLRQRMKLGHEFRRLLLEQCEKLMLQFNVVGGLTG